MDIVEFIVDGGIEEAIKLAILGPDKNPPLIVFPTISGGKVVEETTYTVSGSVSDESGLLAVEVSCPQHYPSIQKFNPPVKEYIIDETCEAPLLDIPEPKTYNVAISAINDSVKISTRTQEITVTPDRPIVTIEVIDDQSFEGYEGDLDKDKGVIRISRTGDTTYPLDVHFVVSGTATNGVDYGEIDGLETLPAGSHSLDRYVWPYADKETEVDETVVLTCHQTSIIFQEIRLRQQ